jgi:hypothetical protein
MNVFFIRTINILQSCCITFHYINKSTFSPRFLASFGCYSIYATFIKDTVIIILRGEKNMRRKIFLSKKKLVDSLFLTTAILIAALMIGSAASAGIARNIQQSDKNKISPNLSMRPDSLAPQTKNTFTLRSQNEQNTPLLDRGSFYAYNAYDPSSQVVEGPITFDVPATITLLAPTGSTTGFVSGADMDSEGNWYATTYYGGFYSINSNDGTMTFIGAQGAMNGLAYDSSTETWYAIDSYSLYTVDVTTGATTLVGALGTANTLIGIAVDNAGTMYAYDVLFSGLSSLYTIDKTTGAATVVGSMGIGFIYAQDPAYDRDNSILYIAGYTQSSTGGLYTCDVTTGLCTLVGGFQGNMEVDGFAVPWSGVQYDHDVGIVSIIKPVSGKAAASTPEVKVKNFGLNDETNVPVNFKIEKRLVTPETQDFEMSNGGYTHFGNSVDAWEYGEPESGPMAAHSGDNVWATNLDGNYPASMWCSLVTPSFVVPNEATFEFYQWYDFEQSWDGGNVKISNDSGATWNIVTPVGGYPGAFPSALSPYMSGQPAFTGSAPQWAKVVFDIGSYQGQTVQIKFETSSDSQIEHAGWYIDDVTITTVTWPTEYDHTVYVNLNSGEILDINFTEWTPADLFVSENVVIDYLAEAQTQLIGDEKLQNDYKSKLFSLTYVFFHDVAVTSITSPIDADAGPQIPQAVVTNIGQFDEPAVTVRMLIEKKGTPSGSTEDFETTNGGYTTLDSPGTIWE